MTPREQIEQAAMKRPEFPQDNVYGANIIRLEEAESIIERKDAEIERLRALLHQTSAYLDTNHDASMQLSLAIRAALD